MRMRIKCVSNEGYTDTLTAGKLYDAVTGRKGGYGVWDNDDECRVYPEELFEEAEEVSGWLRLKCISDGGDSMSLTVGEIYDAVPAAGGKGGYGVYDNTNDCYAYPEELFEPVK